MQLHAHQVIVSRVERRHEMRRDGDGNEENGGVSDRGEALDLDLWVGGREGRMEDIVTCREDETRWRRE